jgi:hypothetical protein
VRVRVRVPSLRWARGSEEYNLTSDPKVVRDKATLALREVAALRRRPLGRREGNRAVKWLAGALVVLAAAIVAAALIVARSSPTVNVHVDGPVTVCHTISLTVNTCR